MIELKDFEQFCNEMDGKFAEISVDNNVIESYSEREAKETVKRLAENIVKLANARKINEHIADRLTQKLPAQNFFVFKKEE